MLPERFALLSARTKGHLNFLFPLMYCQSNGRDMTNSQLRRRTREKICASARPTVPSLTTEGY